MTKTSEEQVAFAKKWAGKKMTWAGEPGCGPQEVVVCGYPEPSTNYVTVRLSSTEPGGIGWKRSVTSAAAVWFVDADPADPEIYWYVKISMLTPCAASAPKYPNFPHKCTACGEPAYVGAYDVDCISPACVYYRGAAIVFKGIKT